MKSAILAVAASLAGTSLAGPINLNRVPTPAGLYGVPSLSGVPTPAASGIPSVPTPALPLGSDVPSQPKLARPDLPIVQGLNLANLPAGLPLGPLHRRQLSGVPTPLPLPVDQGSVNHVVDASGLAPFTDVDQTLKKVENEPKDFVNKATKIAEDEPLVRRELPLDTKLPQDVNVDVNANGVTQALNGLPIKTDNVPDKVDDAKNSVPLDMNPVNRLPVTARDVHVNANGPVNTNNVIDTKDLPVDAHLHANARGFPVNADGNGVQLDTQELPVEGVPVKAKAQVGARDVDVNTDKLVGSTNGLVNTGNVPVHADARVGTRDLPVKVDGNGVEVNTKELPTQGVPANADVRLNNRDVTVDTDEILKNGPAHARVSVAGN